MRSLHKKISQAGAAVLSAEPGEPAEGKDISRRLCDSGSHTGAPIRTMGTLHEDERTTRDDAKELDVGMQALAEVGGGGGGGVGEGRSPGACGLTVPVEA